MGFFQTSAAKCFTDIILLSSLQQFCEVGQCYPLTADGVDLRLRAIGLL